MDAFTKVLLAFVMILGRLEIYTLLVLFTAFFWKE
jgi:Trk-type K+ transport system membrane component